MFAFLGNSYLSHRDVFTSGSYFALLEVIFTVLLVWESLVAKKDVIMVSVMD